MLLINIIDLYIFTLILSRRFQLLLLVQNIYLIGTLSVYLYNKLNSY